MCLEGQASLLAIHWSGLQVLPGNMTPGFFSLLQTLERQKMSVDSMKRPLMMAALNGLYVARMPVPESPAEDGAKASTDERVGVPSHFTFFHCLDHQHQCVSNPCATTMGSRLWQRGWSSSRWMYCFDDQPNV